jgi:hypothetical protein
VARAGGHGRASVVTVRYHASAILGQGILAPPATFEPGILATSVLTQFPDGLPGALEPPPAFLTGLCCGNGESRAWCHRGPVERCRLKW